MNADQIRDRYEELYEGMIASENDSKRRIFDTAESWAFDRMLEMSPEMAEKWIGMLEASEWCNYITQEEYDHLNAKLENQDGSMGGHWSFQDIMDAVTRMGKKTSCKPFYNDYALALTMNMLYSDHKNSAMTFMQESSLPAFFYSMAIEKLKDRDRENFIRPYFDI